MTTTVLTERHIYRAALSCIPELTARRFFLLLERFQSESEICKASIQTWAEDKRLGLGADQVAPLQVAVAAIDLSVTEAALTRQAIWCLLPEENLFPPQLAQIPDPPFILFGRGKPEVLLKHQLAVVGTRGATRAGRAMTSELCQQLVQAGLVITSGLALGIDAAAHLAALQAGGETVAVLGNGIDQCYPASHMELYKKIIQAGCVVSEYAPGFRGTVWSFPRRNRIISGLSLGTLVVEAGEKSGALITVRHALEQDREVFVVPGHPSEPKSLGSNRLIQQGAKLVLNVEDIVSELQGVAGPVSPDQHRTLGQRAAGPDPADDAAISDHGKKIWHTLGSEALPMEKLSKLSGLPVTVLTQELTLLELGGYVVRTEGGLLMQAR